MAPSNFTREVWDKTPLDTLRFLDQHEVLELLECGPEVIQELASIESLIEEFETHIKRSPHSGKVRSSWHSIKENVKTGRTEPSTLVKFARGSKLMLEQTRKSKLEASLMESLLAMSDFGALASERLYDLDQHQAFLNEFSKAFKCRPTELAEAVSSGLNIYLDEADTNKLLSQRALALEDFSMKHGYHCVRRGSLSDVSHGHSGNRVSKWTFIKL